MLLGKINGEVLAAVTMAFPGDAPTVMPLSNAPEHTSCATSMRRWFTSRANYTPSNTEECYIEMIGVKKGYRRNGIGAAMIECVEHFAREAGATSLTIHTTGDELRAYFGRFGFDIDRSDNSAVWKWLVERQTFNKLSKTLNLDEADNDLTAGSYVNESMTESVDE